MGEVLKRKQAELGKLMMEVREMELTERIKAEYPKYKDLPGKYLKYRNCYSSPKEDSDYWWIYAFVESVSTRNGTVMMKTIEVDKNGELRVKPTHEMHWQYLDRWIPAEKEEFDGAVDQALKIVSGKKE